MPGESKTLSFKIRASELSFYDSQTNDLKTGPEQWETQVGSSSKDIRLKEIISTE